MSTDGLYSRPLLPVGVIKSKNVINAQKALDGGGFILEATDDFSELTLDMEDEIVCRISLDIVCETGGGALTVYTGELPSEVEREHNFTIGWYVLPCETFGNLKPGAQALKMSCRSGLRYIRLKAEDCRIKVVKLNILSEGYPVEKKGMFRCSDDRLNRIWDMCVHTEERCMQRFYEDGVKRDGMLWMGDYRVEFLSQWYGFGDIALARKSLAMLIACQHKDGAIPADAADAGGHQHPENIPYMFEGKSPDSEWVILNYAADFISAMREYCIYTGDVTFIRENLGAIKRDLSFIGKSTAKIRDAVYNTPDKLAEALDGTVLTDNNIDGGGVFSVCTMLFQYMRAFNDAEKLGELLEDKELVSESAAALSLLVPLLNEKFLFNGVYKDPGDCGKYSQDRYPTMTAALSSSNIEGTQPEYLGNPEVLKGLFPIGGWMMVWAVEARFRYGQKKEALDDIRRRWGYMSDNGLKTTLERINAVRTLDALEDDNCASCCHGWTGGPAWLLNEYVIGLTPVAPGFSQIRLRPDLCDLEYAETTVPMPDGDPIFISLRKEKGKTVLYTELPSAVKICNVETAAGTVKLVSGRHKLVI